ncbi:hypothetical protein M8C21_029345, partial [Ambrosia artemisiifolia]
GGDDGFPFAELIPHPPYRSYLIGSSSLPTDYGFGIYSGTTVTLTPQARLRRVDLYLRTTTEKGGEFKHRWSDPPMAIQAANDAIIGGNDGARENYAAVKNSVSVSWLFGFDFLTVLGYRCNSVARS